MLIEEAVTAVRDKLQAMEGLRGLLILDDAQRDAVIEEERQAEEDAKRFGLINVINEGFWATFGREIQVALVLDAQAPVAHRTDQLLQLKDQEGRKIGEGVGPGTLQGRSGDQSTLFINKEFVLFEGVKVVGEPYFAIPEIELDLLHGVKGIQRTTSCSPSAQVDKLIRHWSGLNDKGLFTRILGFDIDRDDLD
jgi:hypothetical protein